MRNIAFALFVALLLPLASAEWTAQFSANSSSLDFSPLSTYSAGRHFTYNPDGSINFRGHFGSYIVTVGSSQGKNYVMVGGPDESRVALISEVEWLKQNGILKEGCASSDFPQGNDQYCTSKFGWEECTASSGCARPPSFDKAEPSEGIGGSAFGARQEKSPIGAPAGAQAQSFAPLQSGEAGAAESADSGALPQQAPPETAGAAESAAAAAPKPLEAGQFLPLAAAFLAIAIISSLILQQRQVQVQLDPQEERLLQNQTRAGIMEQLEEADRIPTDLSAKLGKSKATVVEHLETLVGAGFVEKLATPGKKFVYYRLTHKGKAALLRMAG